MPRDAATPLRRKAGHLEIIGETIAKIEFFDEGWNPYHRFLDVDRVDLVLRKRSPKGDVLYRDIQVKYGRLYRVTNKWEKALFDVTSWRFYDERSLDDLDQRGLYVAYVLANEPLYDGDIFVFRAQEFVRLLRLVPANSKGARKIMISRSLKGNNWYLRLTPKRFTVLNKQKVLDVTKHYRNFSCLDVRRSARSP